MTNKYRIILGVALLCAFVFGFTFGLLEGNHGNAAPVQHNNTPIQNYNQYKKAQTVKPDPNCPIKGKKNAKGKSIYHLPGDPFYAKVKPTDCFKTEAEAQAAGFAKAKSLFNSN